MAGTWRRFPLSLALALALGWALVFLVHQLVDFVLVAVRPLGESNLLGAYPPQYVARIGRHALVYGGALEWLITFAILLTFAWLLRRRLQPTEAQHCPHCLSRVPTGARVCRACTRDLTTAYPLGY